MGLYEVYLGIDRAARDTGRRLRLTVLGQDRLSAAAKAEAMADATLDDPVEYSHAIGVEPLRAVAPSAAALLAA